MESHPDAFFDTEVFNVGIFGVVPYTNEKFKRNFRHNSLFIGNNTRDAVNKGLADYTPLFFSKTPKAFYDELVPIDMALIQTSPPDEHGYMSLGISVDITKAAVDKAAMVIAQNKNMTAINSAQQIDLTGQATVESIGKKFYSGIGGATLAQGGKTILTIQSTALGGWVSRIMSFLGEGSGVTLGRGDVQYVVTEYGIAYIHGKNIRERAMDLIAISHPKFRPRLISEAKKLNLIYRDQAFIPGRKGEYPESLETQRTTHRGLTILLRPVKIRDEPLLKHFFYSLSDESTYKRFISTRKDMHHERLQELAVIDYTREMVILAVIQNDKKEEIVGIGQYDIMQDKQTAEVAFVVRDDYQKKGIGTELMSYLTHIAKKQGLLGFMAVVLMENKTALHLFEKMGFDIQMRSEEGVYELKMAL